MQIDITVTLATGNRLVDTMQTHDFLHDSQYRSKYLILLVGAEGLEPSTP